MGINFDFGAVEQKLSEMSNKMSKEVTERALKKAGAEVLNEMQNTVPKDTHALEEALEVGQVKGTGTNRKVKVGIPPEKNEKFEYGWYQEVGTEHFVGKKWMKKAYVLSLNDANKVIIEELKRELGL
jgi:HK97 gp10 family phage protein